MTNEVVRLPVPDRLEPKKTKRSLLNHVRDHFYTLYNSGNPQFREYLASVGNKDAITGRRDFDRHEAVRLIQEHAKHAKDTVTLEAIDGEIYSCIVKCMQNHPDLKPKLRRVQFAQLQHQQAAE